MWIMLALLPDSLSNALVNTNTQLLAPTIRGTNIYANNLPSLRKVVGNLNTLYLRKETWTEHSAWLNQEKLFGTKLTLSTFNIV